MGGFEDNQLIATDAAPAVGNGAGGGGRQGDRVLAGVDDDEVVAETVHLYEGQAFHGRLIWAVKARKQRDSGRFRPEITRNQGIRSAFSRRLTPTGGVACGFLSIY